MAKLDLLDVVRLAREFSEEAGWGFFKVKSIIYDNKTGHWSIIAELGAMYGALLEFKINDDEGKVIEFKPHEG